jgi:hypothetical protein
MTGAVLYLRSRRVPMAVAVALGTAAVWALVLRDRAVVALIVQLMVAVLATTLSAPDEDLDRTASMRWPRWRAAHLLALVLPIMTTLTFAPAALVLRDATGLLGLTALCACVVGVARSWFLPMGWTVVAVAYTQPGTRGALATWQAQPHDSRPAAVLAVVLAVTGLCAYAFAGPARPSVPGQDA